MDTKLIEDFETELAAHAAALEKAAELCEAQAARIKELEAENSEAADHVARAEMAEKAMKCRRPHQRLMSPNPKTNLPADAGRLAWLVMPL